MRSFSHTLLESKGLTPTPPRNYSRFFPAAFLLIGLCCSHSSIAQNNLDSLRSRMESLYKDGKYQEALPIARELLDTTKKIKGPESPDAILAIRYVANIDTILGNNDEAEALLLQAEAILSKSSVGTIEYGQILNVLGVFYHDRNVDYHRAESYTRKSIAVLEKIGPPNGRDLLAANVNLASLLDQEGRAEEALIIDNRVIETWEKSSSTVNFDLARMLLARGKLYSDMGEYEESEADLERCLPMLRTLMGENHKDVGIVLGIMGQNEVHMNRLDEAVVHWNRAIEIFERTFGKESYHVGYALAGLAKVDAARKEYEKAEGEFQKGISIIESSAGADSPKVAWQLNALGEMYLDQEAIDNALKTLEKAKTILEKNYGKDGIYNAPNLLDLGIAQRKKQNYSDALAILNRALEIEARLKTPRYRLLSRELVQKTLIYIDQGNCVDADKISEEALELEQIHELQDPNGYREALLVRSNVLECLGKPDEAAQMRSSVKHIQN